MPLKQYQHKRDFRRSPEPKGKRRKSGSGRLYVIHKHDASRLHYDLRLEHGGVLLSWAVPKGPSLDPAEKRLAVRVEDHPVEYGEFEGTIPQDQYGGGTVMLWDRGEWKPDGDPKDALDKGKLKFTLDGDKLRGGWTLVRMRGRDGDSRDNWLLIKEKDDQARSLVRYDVLEEEPDSVASGRSLERIADKAGDVWQSGRQRNTRKPSSRTKRRASKKASERAPPDTARLSNARKAPFPRSVSPQLTTLVDQVPEGDHWLHEIKFDGYRLIAMLKDGKSKLITRNGKDWSRKFPTVGSAIAKLPVDSAVLDGEVIVQNRDGTQDFQALQNVMKGARDADLSYYVFDVMYCNGFDLMRTPLIERKECLRRLLGTSTGGSTLRYSDHIQGTSSAVYDHACRLGMEGIISKRAAAPYEQKRSRSWLKIKCFKRQEFVIGGYTDPRGSRSGFGALLLGYHENGDLVYAGRVGTGFDEPTLKRLHGRLKELEHKTSPFTKPPTGGDARGVHWIKPTLVAEVAFAQWTSDGLLRHPSFEGLREDKPADEIVRERPRPAPGDDEDQTMSKNATASRVRRGTKSADVQVGGVRLSNPEKVLYPDQGLTKQDIARFYEGIADWVLPHVTGRPLTIVRCPEGRGADCFYQKHVTDNLPDAIHSVTLAEKNSEGEYIVINDLAGLVSLVQLGALELHPWGSRADDADKPDRLVFDLDPAPDVAWSAVVEGARILHEQLGKLGLDSFLKTSGGKGLHIVVPIARRTSWVDLKAIAKAVADGVVAADPKHYIATMSKAKRKGKIFIDYLRNGRGATSVAAYSTRARPGATVSTPLRWDELSDSLDPTEYNVANIPRRLSSLKRDPWSGFFTTRQSITAAMKKVL